MVKPAQLAATPQDRVWVHWQVTNAGNGAAQPSWYDRVYLSTDAQWSSNDQQLTYQQIQTALDAGGRYVRNAYVTLPQVVAGSYWLIVRTDKDNTLYESNETNNTLAVPVQVALPDLTVSSAGGVNLRQLELTNRQVCAGPYPESAHPYANSTDQSWTQAYAGAEALVLTFDSRCAGQAYYDQVQVMDGNGQAIDGSPFDLGALAGQTKVVFGDTVQVRFTSNSSTTGWGFALTSIERADVVEPAQLAATPQDRVWVHWQVTNAGNGAAQPSWHDRVYFSTDAQWSSSDQQLASQQIQTTVGAGQPYVCGAYVTLPQVVAGSYWLIVRTDKDNTLYLSLIHI